MGPGRTPTFYPTAVVAHFCRSEYSRWGPFSLSCIDQDVTLAIKPVLGIPSEEHLVRLRQETHHSTLS